MKKIIIALAWITTGAFAQKSDLKASVNLDTITLGGGCYWCVEAVYEQLEGVTSVVSGFSGGTTANPTYEEVSTGKTGYAEAVQITFDKSKTNLDEIFKVFFTVHDPTTLNQQGPDKGTQYRSVIFYATDEEKEKAKAYIQKLLANKKFKSITTECVAFEKFYKAEDYHQNFERDNPDNPYIINGVLIIFIIVNG